MAFQPHGTLRNRSFIGLLIAQFQAAFSDQCIQAAAMFYAIRLRTLDESVAISLLPILFYSPWALFVTWAGYLADKFSKQYAIRFWKFFEIGIVTVTAIGFCFGSIVGRDPDAAWARYLGSYLVMSTVFLMGMQSAFFVPAKYGIMPEMLKPHLLSRGNGILESLSFLAIILGTVAGGILIWFFGESNYYFDMAHQEPWIGLILICLSIIGAACSLLVERVPAAHPDRKFPWNPFKPIYLNCRLLLRSRPLLFAVLGIAFFTFMVAFMRNTMYMHGESRIDRWSEMHTSLVVGVVALGIGLGAPLAGFLSGGKVELGLVPLGGLGMVLALVASALVLNFEPLLVTCVATIGFFTGFYIVPLFALLQHRAPKQSKGDIIATSNFINVVGAILASVLFWGVVQASLHLGIVHEVPIETVAKGELLDIEYGDHGKVLDYVVKTRSGEELHLRQWVAQHRNRRCDLTVFEKTGTLVPASKGETGTKVHVFRYVMSHAGDFPWSPSTLVEHYRIQPETIPPKVLYQERLPRFLFLGGAVMTLAILWILWRQLPDLFARALLWLRALGRYHLKVFGIEHLPQEEPAILATNCDTHETALQVVAVTDRPITFLLLRNPEEPPPGWQLRYLARSVDALDLPGTDAPPHEWERVVQYGREALRRGNLLGITADSNGNGNGVARLFEQVHDGRAIPIVPVWCGDVHAGEDHIHGPMRHVRVVIGEPLPPDATLENIRACIHALGKWVCESERDTGDQPPACAAASRVPATPADSDT